MSDLSSSLRGYEKASEESRGSLTREEIQRDVAVIFRVLEIRAKPKPKPAPPPVFHCHWCAAPLKRPAKACTGHADVEELWQHRYNPV